MGRFINRGVLALLLVGVLFGCGESKTLKLTYEAASTGDKPDLIVIISLDANGENPKENLEPLQGGIRFSDAIDSLKKCSVFLKYIDGASAGFSPTASVTDCITMANFYKANIFNLSPSFEEDALSERAPSLRDTSNGYAFVLFFFNGQSANATKQNRCVQIFGSKIENKKFVQVSGGATVTSDVADMGTLAKVVDGSLPDPNLCFSFK